MKSMLMVKTAFGLFVPAEANGRVSVNFCKVGSQC